jgi:hypothetical protein
MNFFDNNKKSILIYNPLSHVGHFDSWCAIFTKCLLDSGWTICVITKNSQKIFDTFPQEIARDASPLLILDDHSVIKDNHYYNFCRNVLNKFKVFEFLERIQIEIKPSPLKERMRFLKRGHNYCVRKIANSFKKIFQPKLIISATNPQEFASDINCAINLLGTPPKVVMNMYVDLYTPDSEIWEIFAQSMQCKWVGIHMDMTHSLVNRPYWKSAALKTIFTINEPATTLMDGGVKEMNYQWLPDVTDISMPVSPSQITIQIQERANGRNIIFLGGAIGGTKNLSLWSELVFKADKSKFFFVQVGKIDYGTLSAHDLAGLQQLLSIKSENFFYLDDYLSDEAVFNELVSKSAVIWGLYRDFDRSSNILTKAALFSKPIIVSKNYLMGQRVNQYKIGCAISETHVHEALDAINYLIENPICADNFKNYSAVYSTQALSAKLDQSLVGVI